MLCMFAVCVPVLAVLWPGAGSSAMRCHGVRAGVSHASHAAHQQCCNGSQTCMGLPANAPLCSARRPALQPPEKVLIDWRRHSSACKPAR